MTLGELVCRGGWPAKVDRPLAAACRTNRDDLERVRQVDVATLAADAGGADGPLDPRTVADHLQALEQLMVLEHQPAWRRHFGDPSLAVAALGASPQRLLHDLEWLGLLFEALVVRDLRVLAQALDGKVVHDRDNDGLEVDAIVQLRDGRWGAIDIKLGAGQVDAAAASAWCRWEAWSSELKPHGCSS